jgi:hypothetical protein
MSEAITIAILSQNLQEESILTKLDFPFLKPVPQLVVIGTQEDGRNPSTSNLLVQDDHVAGLRSFLIQGNPFQRVGTIALNNNTFKKNVRLSVYSVEIPTNVTMGKIDVPAKRSVSSSLQAAARFAGVVSKGCVWIKMTYLGRELLFVNCHLPMHKKEPGLGFVYRTEAFKIILEKLRKLMSPSTTVFLTGDLNFRMDPEREPNSQNQLTRILPELPIAFQELPTPPGKAESITCKLKPSTNTRCRLQNVKSITNTSCLDPDRIPSRCDRILFSSKEDPIVYRYETFVMNPAFDHNGVLGIVTIGGDTDSDPFNTAQSVNYNSNTSISSDPIVNTSNQESRRSRRRRNRQQRRRRQTRRR